MFTVKVWGDRGSMPVPGAETVIFGGNTACIEIRCGERILIVDAGSGIRGLGDYIVRNDLKYGPIKADIFLTHTHWDHIMGFPMFTPIYIPGTKLFIHGPVNFEDETLEQIIGAQLSYRYWPVRQDELAAKIQYESLKETMMDLGDGIVVRTKYLNHPVLCLGYRFEYMGKSFATVFDHEPYSNLFPTDPTHPDYDEMIAEEGNKAAKEENARVEAFYKGVDLLIHDTQYSAKEYRNGKVGWGHSSFEYAINAANRSGVKKLFLFHHDPNRTDAELQELELFYQAKVNGKSSLSVEVSREGVTVHLV